MGWTGGRCEQGSRRALLLPAATCLPAEGTASLRARRSSPSCPAVPVLLSSGSALTAAQRGTRAPSEPAGWSVAKTGSEPQPLSLPMAPSVETRGLQSRS